MSGIRSNLLDIVSGKVQTANQLLGLAGGCVPASLAADGVLLDIPVSFSLNPKSVSLTKANKTESDRGVITSKLEDAIKATSNIRLNLGEAYLTGAGFTTLAIDQLIEWATPAKINPAEALELGNSSAVKSAVDTVIMNKIKNGLGNSESSSFPAPSSTLQPSLKDFWSSPVYYKLPVLRFMWGIGAPFHNKLVNLEKVTVDYQRFDFTGTPVWARIALTLVEFTRDPPPTNPTSRGVPGRTRHVVTQGENIMQIAHRAYGSPNAWRRVAEANGIDDPLRVKPGRTLMLPPADLAPERGAR
ncbi:hypothetical protein [Amycolatopsis sp. NPDC051071]|uniref:LysM peptidoglycan-binding domain-containing protein n=1 Tax=Amycolatopsis sp. NPDC051071 TaxID=3154637 RepID=UPI0034126588